MTISYKLNKDLVGRAAAQFNWAVSSTQGSIRIINTEGRMINAKSLVGLLSGILRTDDEIYVVIDNINDLQKVRKAFAEIAIEK